MNKTTSEAEYDRDWSIFVIEQMELYAKNPSNRNKYYTNLMTKIDKKVSSAKQLGQAQALAWVFVLIKN